MNGETYTIEKVPTFLLYDALSWCMKNEQPHATFYMTFEQSRWEVIASPAAIYAELERRKTEIVIWSDCCNCGAPTDGRCYFREDEPLCPRCYWVIMKALAARRDPPTVYDPRRNKDEAGPGSIMVTSPPPKKLNAAPVLKESQEEIASRLGVSVETLLDSGYFD